jgi:hypothetical protein
MSVTVLGHQITWLEVKGFVKEAAAIAGVIVTIAHADHLTAFYDGLGVVSSLLLGISHTINTTTNATLKVKNADPTTPPGA